MSDKLNNNEFDQDKDFQNLHEKYQSVSTELPPASVDANILRAAHSVQDIHLENKNNFHAWYVPASAVAIIVLSLSVVLKLAFEPEDSLPQNMLSPQTEIEGAGYSADEATLQADESSLKRRMQFHEEKEMAPQLKRRKAQQQLELRQEVSVPAHVVREKKSLQKQKMKSASTYSRDHEQVKIAAKPENVQESGGAIPVTAAPVASQPESVSSTGASGAVLGLIAKPASNKSQRAKIKHLMELYETQQFDKLGLALQAYRNEYPANYSVINSDINADINSDKDSATDAAIDAAIDAESEVNDTLPAVLLEWELHNRKLDNTELDYTE